MKRAVVFFALLACAVFPRVPLPVHRQVPSSTGPAVPGGPPGCVSLDGCLLCPSERAALSYQFGSPLAVSCVEIASPCPSKGALGDRFPAASRISCAIPTLPPAPTLPTGAEDSRPAAMSGLVIAALSILSILMIAAGVLLALKIRKKCLALKRASVPSTPAPTADPILLDFLEVEGARAPMSEGGRAGEGGAQEGSRGAGAGPVGGSGVHGAAGRPVARF